MNNASSVVVGLLVLAWICYRQTQTRPVRDSLRLPLILAVVGLVDTVQAVQGAVTDGDRLPVAGLALLALSVLLGAALAVARGMLMHVWVEGTTTLRRGNALTVVLWVVSVGAHLGIDALVAHVAPRLSGIGSASLLLYLGCVLGLQQLVLQRRVVRPAVPVA